MDAVDAALLSVYLNKPWLVINDESKLKQTGTLLTDIDTPIRQEIKMADKADPFIDEPVGVPVGVMIKKPNFWTFSGDQNLQFMQNYLSENWHKGGESNYSLVANVVLNANYNNKQRLKFDNKLELKLGFRPPVPTLCTSSRPILTLSDIQVNSVYRLQINGIILCRYLHIRSLPKV